MAPSVSHYHLFSLPPELLDTLTPRTLLSQTASQSLDSTPQNNQDNPSDAAENPSATGRSCNICLGAVFEDVDSQRSHFRSDWHRFNVKNRLKGGKAVTEPEFTQLVDGLEDSLSGSESSESDASSDESDAVQSLVNKTKKLTPDSPTDSRSPSIPITALLWFHSPPSTQLGIYRTVFPLNTPFEAYLPELKAMQQPGEYGRTWAMFMVAGGHFAGAIIRVSKSEEERALEEEENEMRAKKNKPKRFKPETEVITHKTFHRYTTRRKQGGSQSLNDNAKSKATSAGAQLRRYGEQALRDDIRGLLEEWAEELDGCERIWIRATGSNRKSFMDYDGAVIQKNDPRLRGFPFPTRRPTQAELTRCLMELTKVKISHLTEEALREQDEAYLASLPKPKPVPSAAPTPAPEKPKQPPPLSKEEILLRDKWERLLEMIQKGRLDPLKGFWEKEGSGLGGIDVTIPEFTGVRQGTLLQVAASSGQEAITQWLLEDQRANPAIEVPSTRAGEPVADEPPAAEAEQEDGDAEAASASVQPSGHRTAYDISRTKPVRDVFRRCAADHPDWWDWFGAGHVPSGLSKEREAERDEKKKVRRKGLKDRVKERESKQQSKQQEEEEIEASPTVTKVASKEQTSGPQKLGGAPTATEGLAGLTPEMRAKVERERRARAAEARLKGLGR